MLSCVVLFLPRFQNGEHDDDCNDEKDDDGDDHALS